MALGSLEPTQLISGLIANYVSYRQLFIEHIATWSIGFAFFKPLGSPKHNPSEHLVSSRSPQPYLSLPADTVVSNIGLLVFSIAVANGERSRWRTWFLMAFNFRQQDWGNTSPSWYQTIRRLLSVCLSKWYFSLSIESAIWFYSRLNATHDVIVALEWTIRFPKWTSLAGTKRTDFLSIVLMTEGKMISTLLFSSVFGPVGR